MDVLLFDVMAFLGDFSYFLYEIGVFNLNEGIVKKYQTNHRKIFTEK